MVWLILENNVYGIMDDSMVFFFNYCFRKVINRLGVYFYLGFLVLVLTGCPTQFERFEQYYFQDRFIDAVILAHDQNMASHVSDKLNVFLERNSMRLNKNLLLEINQFDASISDEDVDRLKLLLQSLDFLQVTYPGVTLDYSVLISAIRYAMDGYVAKKKFDIGFLLTHKRYRQTKDSLLLLQEQEALLSTQNQLLNALKGYLDRNLVIYDIRVHDQPIEDFKDAKAIDHYSNYLKKGRSLLEYSVDVPVEFLRHLNHHFVKEKSDYLLLNEEVSDGALSHYRLVCSVGVLEKKSLIKQRREIDDMFLVKFDSHSDWQQEDVVYEIFVDTTTYTASVDAAIYLGDTDMVLGHYIFEVHFPVEEVEVGDFLHLPDNSVEMTYSQRYKGYTEFIPLHETSFYIQHILDDAANVLVVKVLNSIDRDPDPYSVQYPLQFP